MDALEVCPVRIPAPLKVELRKLAEANHRSMTAEVQIAIERHVAAQPESQGDAR